MLRMSHKYTIGGYKPRPYFRTGPSGLNIATPAVLPPTNLVSSYCADLGITKDGSDYVSQWDDQTSTNHLTQAGSTTKPKWYASVIGTHSGLTFDGSNDNMRATFTLNQPSTAYVVFKPNAWGSGLNIIDGGAARAFLAQYGNDGEYIIFAGSLTAARVTFATGSFYLASLVLNGNSSTLKKNADSAVAMSGVGGGNPGGLTVGDDYANAHPSSCTITDVAVYSVAHDATQQAAVAAYYLSHIPGLWS